jgi:hypothetical protein
VRQQSERVERLEQAIRDAVPEWSLAEVVTALQAMRGIDRRQVDPRQRTPLAAGVASGSGQLQTWRRLDMEGDGPKTPIHNRIRLLKIGFHGRQEWSLKLVVSGAPHWRGRNGALFRFGVPRSQFQIVMECGSKFESSPP